MQRLTIHVVLLTLCLPACKNENIALNKPVQSSSVHPDRLRSLIASNAVDGNKDRNYDHAGCFTTHSVDPNPWWMVDLGRNYHIHNITIYNRDTRKEHLRGFFIEMFRVHPLSWSNSAAIPCLFREAILYDVETLTCDTPVTGRYVRIRKIPAGEFLFLCEVEITGTILTGQECGPGQHIDKFNDQRLVTSSQQTLIASSELDCVSRCRYTPHCLDINFNRNTHQCQLINLRADDDQLVLDPDWIFVSLP